MQIKIEKDGMVIVPETDFERKYLRVWGKIK